MTSPSEELRDTLARVASQNAVVRDAAREAVDEANARRESEFQQREVTPDGGANPSQ